VKFTDFVSPGRQLQITVQQLSREGSLASFKFQGEVEGRTCVSGRLTVECTNLADENALFAEVDARLIEYQKQQQALLTRGLTIQAAT
jgi:hypothetical protein